MEFSPSRIPIIDLGDQRIDDDHQPILADYVNEACELAGCFYIRNHGIDYGLIGALLRDFRAFFDEPLEYKSRYKVDYSLNRGYFPYETQNVSAFMGKLNLPNDPVEKFAFGPPYCDKDHDSGTIPARRHAPREAPNLWPDNPPTLKPNVVQFHTCMRELADKLLRVFAVAIEAPDPDYFYRRCHDAAHSMKANWYPPAGKRPRVLEQSSTTRFAEHFDITAFTILTTDDCAKSLQVKNARGEWVYADPVPGALFVNLGLALQRWTNDKWKATLHRVVWPENNDDQNGCEIPGRMSIVYFVLLNDDSVIECIPSCIRHWRR